MFNCFSKIERLKDKARRNYLSYQNELDTLSCGASLGEYVNPRMLSAKLEFNRVMDELAEIDPATPGTRL